MRTVRSFRAKSLFTKRTRIFWSAALVFLVKVQIGFIRKLSWTIRTFVRSLHIVRGRRRWRRWRWIITSTHTFYCQMWIILNQFHDIRIDIRFWYWCNAHTAYWTGKTVGAFIDFHYRFKGFLFHWITLVLVVVVVVIVATFVRIHVFVFVDSHVAVSGVYIGKCSVAYATFESSWWSSIKNYRLIKFEVNFICFVKNIKANRHKTKCVAITKTFRLFGHTSNCQ